MKFDVEKIHSITSFQFGEETEIRFKTKKYPGIKFEVRFKNGEIKSTSAERTSECTLTGRQFNNAGKWVNDFLGELENYFLNECNQTKMLLLMASVVE